ncbi:PAS domain-containing protein [Skermanella sp. TT6]|mgnify:CR=1 FL=1|uniref:PAS domain-containing protein n=1 Tax=Skermanella cutis TaxID=2775420 RepID=A0ABX7BF85_9PROT|nr:PAS domain-containing protein [Skermanella sp. TT6]QQP91938.1 PAS domain-containing protein [Skermanella sp. TT6]
MTDETLVLRHPKLLSLYAFWLEQCAGAPLPLASALNPIGLRPWLGNLLIMDVIRNSDFVYSYYGQSFSDSFGGDRVGQSIARLPEPQGDILRAEYDRVRTEVRPVARVYSADFDGVPSTWERLVLPLTEDGSTVGKLLVGAYKLDRPHPVATGAPRAY